MQLIRVIRAFMHDCFLFSTILSFHPSSMQDKIFNPSPSFRMFRLLHPPSPPRQRGRGRGWGGRGNHKTLIPPMSLLNLMPMGRFANRPCIGTSSSERTRSHNNRSLHEQLFEQATSAFLCFVCLFTYKRAVFPTAQTTCPSVRPPWLPLRVLPAQRADSVWLSRNETEETSCCRKKVHEKKIPQTSGWSGAITKKAVFATLQARVSLV